MPDTVRFVAYVDKKKKVDTNIAVGSKQIALPTGINKIKILHKKKSKTVTGSFGGEMIIYPDDKGALSVAVAKEGQSRISDEQKKEINPAIVKKMELEEEARKRREKEDAELRDRLYAQDLETQSIGAWYR